MKIKYNDNELLYLISENDENAFEILCDKYRPLIISRLRSFKIQEKNFTDFYQECLMVLYQCSENYREDKNFTFNVYLDMSIQNKIRNLLRKDKNYFYNVSLLDVDTIDKITFKEPSYIELGENIEVIKKINNSLDKSVMELYLKGHNIKEISDELKCSSSKLYYILSKYRKKKRIENVDFQKGIFSSLEQRVYELYVKNYRPREIASFLDCDVESVYNAIKRIKLKNKKL